MGDIGGLSMEEFTRVTENFALSRIVTNCSTKEAMELPMLGDKVAEHEYKLERDEDNRYGRGLRMEIPPPQREFELITVLEKNEDGSIDYTRLAFAQGLSCFDSEKRVQVFTTVEDFSGCIELVLVRYEVVATPLREREDSQITVHVPDIVKFYFLKVHRVITRMALLKEIMDAKG